MARWRESSGCIVIGAKLQGASLQEAELQWALLIRAQLQGASLRGAKLEGASLEEANLQGANLAPKRLPNVAELHGASLAGAQLQGASFSDSLLDQVDMRFAKVWRTSFRGNYFRAAVLEDGLDDSAASKDEFAALLADLSEVVPEG